MKRNVSVVCVVAVSSLVLELRNAGFGNEWDTCIKQNLLTVRPKQQRSQCGNVGHCVCIHTNESFPVSFHVQVLLVSQKLVPVR